MAQQPLIIQASRSHSHTPHSAGLLWTSDLPLGRQHTTLTRDRLPRSGGIRTHNLRNRAAAHQCQTSEARILAQC